MTAQSAGNRNRLLKIPDAELEQIVPRLERVSMRPRQFLIPAGDPLSHVYFPYSAMASLVVGMQAGNSIEIATVGRQGMLGISVLFEADPAPYDIICRVPGEAVRLAAQPFIEFAERLPHFRRRLLRYALGLFHEVARTAACNRLHTVEQRLARSLLLCADQVGSDAYPLTHEGLARMLGARRPYVSRVARALQQSGIIEYHRGTLRILDRQRLEAFSCEDYRVTKREYNRLLG